VETLDLNSVGTKSDFPFVKHTQVIAEWAPLAKNNKTKMLQGGALIQTKDKHE
jgi:hypothetical protein